MGIQQHTMIIYIRISSEVTNTSTRSSINIAKVFSGILQDLCSISGALINKRKSDVFGWNVEHHGILWIYHFLGFLGFAIWEKIKYLGLPLTLGSNKSLLWADVLRTMKTKIKAWGGQWLTKAGKLTLVKLVLSSLLIYQTSFLLALKMIME